MNTPETWRATFHDPPRACGMMPQWFWNDDLDEAELLRQLHEFHAKGCGGIMPHPRVGLSRRVGYLTPEYFRLVRRVVDEAARLDMKVVLYDEGSYPSGSAHGRVVAENPAWANRVVVPLRQRLEGPARGFWRSNSSRYLCDRLVTAVAGLETGPDQIDPSSLRVLPSPDGELVPYDLPAGRWIMLAVWDVLSGATIRGVFPEEDDEHALAPAAADLLNPEAVASFIRHTHEGYRQALGEHLGQTVTAIFVDEPGLCGRGARRGGAQARPYTPGFLDDLQAHWDDDVRRWLPALWIDCGPRTRDFRQAWDQALQERQRRIFYAPIAAWCEAHDIALTGHPPRSDESTAQRLFHWPGQDMVWWYVAPGNAQAMGGRANSALEGEHSTAPKGAHSMALLDGRRFTTVEVFGAYGWHLTLDAVKWLLDWHLVRGINLFFPHAFFYSIRGRRAYESEPDLGVHNPWWPHWGVVADYVRRLCWLFTDAEEVCETAILCDPDHIPWTAAKALYEAQITFLYVSPEALSEATLDGSRLRLGRGGVAVSALLADPSPLAVAPAAATLLERWTAAGGRVLREWTPETLRSDLTGAASAMPRWEGPPSLRLRLCRRQGALIALIVNEGEVAVDGILRLPGRRTVELWDPLSGTTRTATTRATEASTAVALSLDRRQGVVLVCHDQDAPLDALPTTTTERRPGPALLEVTGPWETRDESGRDLALPAPGDWSRCPGWELFTGTILYRRGLTLTATEAASAAFLDLGAVGDIASVRLNGEALGVCAWAPYRLPAKGLLRAGENSIEISVTNTRANAAYGRQLPSGLMGPVRLLAGLPPLAVTSQWPKTR